MQTTHKRESHDRRATNRLDSVRQAVARPESVLPSNKAIIPRIVARGPRRRNGPPSGPWGVRVSGRWSGFQTPAPWSKYGASGLSFRPRQPDAGPSSAGCPFARKRYRPPVVAGTRRPGKETCDRLLIRPSDSLSARIENPRCQAGTARVVACRSVGRNKHLAGRTRLHARRSEGVGGRNPADLRNA